MVIYGDCPTIKLTGVGWGAGLGGGGAVGEGGPVLLC